MKWLAHAVALAGLFAVALNGKPVAAKTCPSQLPSNLHEVGESGFSWGIELRNFTYGASAGLGSDNTSGGHLADVLELTLEAGYETGPLYLFVEPVEKAVLEHRSPDVERIIRPFPFVQTTTRADAWADLRQWYAELNLSPLTLRAGRQQLQFGTQLALDNWFDSLYGSYGFDFLTVEAFAGLLATSVAKEGRGCARSVMTRRIRCWDGSCDAAVDDFYGIAGMSLSHRLDAGATIGLLYYRAQTSDPAWRFHMFSGYGRVNLGQEATLFAEASALVRDPYDEIAVQEGILYHISLPITPSFGGSLKLVAPWSPLDKVRIVWTGGLLYGSQALGNATADGQSPVLRNIMDTRDSARRFGTSYGTSPLGFWQRFSEREGMTAYAGMTLEPRDWGVLFLEKHLRLEVHYFLNARTAQFDLLDDELDVVLRGADIWKKRISVWLGYAGIHFAGGGQPMHLGFLELRFLI
jgi:hypothetical protein